MSNASSYEDIRDRLEENRPQRRLYGPLDSLDPRDFDVTDDVFALEVEALRLRVESYALGKSSLTERAPEVQRLYDRNEQSRAQIGELRAQRTPTNAESLDRKIAFLEKAIAERLHVFVDLILTPAQKENVAKFERRLINCRPIENHCYSCKTSLLESSQNYCINCGRVKCTCGHCFCNWGAT